MHLRFLSVNASDELRSFGKPTNRVIRLTDGSIWYTPSNVFGEATAVGISDRRLEEDYSYKTDYEIRRENTDFGRQNISMS